MDITGHAVEKLHDPTGILEGDRYEFFLTIDVPEDDELFSENGITLRVILSVGENEQKIVQYNFIEQITNQTLDFALEEDEEIIVTNYCIQQLENN